MGGTGIPLSTLSTGAEVASGARVGSGAEQLANHKTITKTTKANRFIRISKILFDGIWTMKERKGSQLIQLRELDRSGIIVSGWMNRLI
jgi:hypothetical protein